MPGIPPPLLRSGILSGVDLVVAGGGGQVAGACAALGADVHPLECDLLDEAATTSAAEGLEAADVLVCDAGAPFRALGGGAVALAAALQGSWNATRAVVNAQQRPAGYGRVVLLAPRPADGADAGAARAALENLARTTSVEWARLGIRVVVGWPGDATTDATVADFVTYLASPAGDYFSGCVLELGAAAAAQPSGSS